MLFQGQMLGKQCECHGSSDMTFINGCPMPSKGWKSAAGEWEIFE